MPSNPQLAEPLYLTKYIERMGTGTGDMIRRCIEVGLPEPGFSISDGFMTTIWRKLRKDIRQVTGEVTGEITGEVTGEVERVLLVLRGEMKRAEIQSALGLRHEEYFRAAYLIPALQAHCVEMTIPDKPKSSQQRYRLTEKGIRLQAILMARNES